METESLDIMGWVYKLGLVSMLASAVSALLASKSKNQFVQLLMDFLSVLAVNIGKAKNQDDDR